MYLRNWKRSRRSGCKELPQVMLRQFLRGRGDVRILISFFHGQAYQKGGRKMFEGNSVDLRMAKTISADVVLDDTTHKCKVYRYDMEEDYIYLELTEEDLTAISLDAKYQCYISTKKELLYCTGVVKERYRSESGNMITFRIENGFYSVSEKRFIN